MEIVHQGYLLCTTGALNDGNGHQEQQKIYAVLCNNVLTCYSENPAVQHYTKVVVVSTFDLKSSKIVDSSNSMRPKSFGIESTYDGSFAEFVCPTNSVKFQWVKHLQVQSLSVTNPPSNDRRVVSSPVLLSIKPSLQVQIPLSTSNPSQSPQQGTSKLMASRNLAAKVLTPVPRISYNTGLLDQALNATVGSSTSVTKPFGTEHRGN